MGNDLEKKFTQEDLNKAMLYIVHAENLDSRKQEFSKERVVQVIETLRPYIQEGNIAETCVGTLERGYENEFGEPYQRPTSSEDSPRRGY